MANNEQINLVYIDHKLQVKRIVYDKLLIGLIVIIVGFFASYLLETYKNANIQQTFILQKKYDSIMEIRKIISLVSNDVLELVSWSYVLDTPNKELSKKIESNIRILCDVFNTESLLFDQDTKDAFSQVINILNGLVAKPEIATRKSRSFFNELFDYLTYRLRLQLDNNSSYVYKGFIPIKKSHEEIDNMGAIEYFKINYDSYCSQE